MNTLRRLRVVPSREIGEQVGQVIGPETGALILKRQAKQLNKRKVIFNNTVFVSSGRVINLASIQVLPDNPLRQYILIQNKSAAIIYISWGTKADDFNGTEVVPGGNYEPYITPRSSLYILATVADSNVSITEGYGTR